MTPPGVRRPLKANYERRLRQQGETVTDDGPYAGH